MLLQIRPQQRPLKTQINAKYFNLEAITFFFFASMMGL